MIRRRRVRSIDDDSRLLRLIVALSLHRRTDHETDARPDHDAHSDRAPADQCANQYSDTSSQRQPDARELDSLPSSPVCVGHDALQSSTNSGHPRNGRGRAPRISRQSRQGRDHDDVPFGIDHHRFVVVIRGFLRDLGRSRVDVPALRTVVGALRSANWRSPGTFDRGHSVRGVRS